MFTTFENKSTLIFSCKNIFRKNEPQTVNVAALRFEKKPIRCKRFLYDSLSTNQLYSSKYRRFLVSTCQVMLLTGNTRLNSTTAPRTTGNHYIAKRNVPLPTLLLRSTIPRKSYSTERHRVIPDGIEIGLRVIVTAERKRERERMTTV